MYGVDHRRRRTLKGRLGLKGMGCCGGPTWGSRPTTTINASDSEDEEQHHHHHQRQLHEEQQESSNLGTGHVSDPDCSSPDPENSGGNSINLAAALAAERQLRAGENNLAASPTNVDVNNNNSSNGGGVDENVGPAITAPGTPTRVSLMRLLAERGGGDVEEKRAAAVGQGGGGENDTMCCVCMVRKKGAAFIPCGHTFCRVCSREVWLNRGSCPLCNRSILEVLDIF